MEMTRSQQAEYLEMQIHEDALKGKISEHKKHIAELGDVVYGYQDVLTTQQACMETWLEMNGITDV